MLGEDLCLQSLGLPMTLSFLSGEPPMSLVLEEH